MYASKLCAFGIFMEVANSLFNANLEAPVALDCVFVISFLNILLYAVIPMVEIQKMGFVFIFMIEIYLLLFKRFVINLFTTIVKEILN